MLVRLGALAERYFPDDSATTIIKLRQLAELLANLVAAHHAIYPGDRQTFEETLRLLTYDRVIPKQAADFFHSLRKVGNAAVHEGRGIYAEALVALKVTRQLAIWFHRTYGKQPTFNAGPFRPPQQPHDAEAALREEIAKLNKKVAESEDAAAKARRAADEHARAVETLEERLKRETEERASWEQLATEVESEKVALAARLAALQSDAERAPKGESVDFIRRGERASEQIDLDEAATRALIDQQLRDAGWDADTRLLRFSAGTRPAKGRNVAITYPRLRRRDTRASQ